MNTTLLLHWWKWRSDNGWFPWLKSQIEFKVAELYIPNLPNSNNPILEEQMEYINIYAGDFKQWWNIIGHSLGCKLALKFVEENNIKNSLIILVAPTYPWLAQDLWEKVFWEAYNNLKKYFDEELNFDKINELNNKIIIFLSDNDEYINMNSAKKYYSDFKNIEFREFQNKGHFNEWAWVLELEEVLEYLD